MLQSNQVLSFFRPRENGGDWSQKELAEFYRVEDALVKLGVSISTDRGLSDEGDPWFVFYRQDNEEVIVHFARIDGEYVVVSNLAEGVVRGRNFQALIRELLESHPYVLPKSNARRQTVYLHPATLLAALVVTGYIKSTELNAGSDDSARAEKGFGWLFNRHDLVAYSAIVIAAVWDSLTSDSSVTKFGDLAWFDDGKASVDTVSVSVGSHFTDGNINLDDLAIRGAHDQSILASTTLSLGEQNASNAGEGWTVASADSKGFVSQLSASHSGDSELPVSNHEVQRLEKHSDLKSGAWHSDQDGTELTLANAQEGHFVAAARPGSSTAPSAVLSSTDAHSSTNPAPAATSAIVDGASSTNALINLSSALHVDPQSVHLVELPATNLTSAVQATLSELNQESGSTEQAGALSTFAPTISVTAQSNEAPFQNFDGAAQHTLDVFLKDTAHYRIESFGHDLLIVDTDLSHFVANDFSVETWKMADGSTLSILGIVAHQAEQLAA